MRLFSRHRRRRCEPDAAAHVCDATIARSVSRAHRRRGRRRRRQIACNSIFRSDAVHTHTHMEARRYFNVIYSISLLCIPRPSECIRVHNSHHTHTYLVMRALIAGIIILPFTSGDALAGQAARPAALMAYLWRACARDGFAISGGRERARSDRDAITHSDTHTHTWTCMSGESIDPQGIRGRSPRECVGFVCINFMTCASSTCTHAPLRSRQKRVCSETRCRCVCAHDGRRHTCLYAHTHTLKHVSGWLADAHRPVKYYRHIGGVADSRRCDAVEMIAADKELVNMMRAPQRARARACVSV